MHGRTQVLDLILLVGGLSKLLGRTSGLSLSLRRVLVVFITSCFLSFALAPIITMFVQDRAARWTHYSTTYGGKLIPNIIMNAFVSFSQTRSIDVI